MMTWKELWMQQERYQELLREAQTERFLRQARTASPQYRRLRRRALIWLGRRLVAWGQSLQCRSGAPVPAINLQAAHVTC